MLIKGVKPSHQKKFFRDLFNLFTLFKRLFPPLPKVRCSNFLNIWNPWGKLMKRNGSYCKICRDKGCKINAQKKVSFSAIFALLTGFFLFRTVQFHVLIHKNSKLFQVKCNMCLVERCFVSLMRDFYLYTQAA